MSNIYWFSNIGKDDVAIAGGKGANLGEMTSVGVPVPPGFIISSKAYFDFIKDYQLDVKIKNSVKLLNVDHSESLEQSSQQIQRLILTAQFPKALAQEIKKAYGKLGDVFVAVRSSATAEDLPQASFAGQQSTFLNIKGVDNLIDAIQKCWASLFEARAIFYRQQQGFDHFKVGIAVVIQEMVQSEKSGVMFTIDPVKNNKAKIIIEAVFGLGELIVSGAVNPDHYEVGKEDLVILNREVVIQDKKLIWTKGSNRQVDVPGRYARSQKLTDQEIVALAKIGKELEKHYFFPQDIEWAIAKGKIFIVQTRAVTTFASGKYNEKQHEQEVQSKTLTEKPLVEGVGASFGVVAGPVKIIKNTSELSRVYPGDVLVTEMTSPDYVPAMKKAVAVVTDKGGRSSHAAIVSRELGIPAVVGTNNATKVLKEGLVVTVDGLSGKIYKGGLVNHTKLNLKRPNHQNPDAVKLPTATKLYVNLAEPDLAHQIAQRNTDGVGLLRAEFMIAGIGIHPKKLIKDKKQQTFINNLADGLKTFCEAFHPRPVVYRATDFKTNEYRHLTGGELYEPPEENPMLGYRGAFRYITDAQVFDLELEAIKYVRNKIGLKNLWLMIPFVRTPQELAKVKKIIDTAGLARSAMFKLWMMVEIPSNVILLDQFIDVGIDGVSIGSNDLTQLILGVDRDNETLTKYFDERDPAVLWALEQTIKTCHNRHITSSICGQAPSIYPEITQKLVSWGVTSVSVSPDMIDHTRQIIYDEEKRLVARK